MNTFPFNPYGHTWFQFPSGTFHRVLGKPGEYYQDEDDEDAGIKYFVFDDLGSLVPVYDNNLVESFTKR